MWGGSPCTAVTPTCTCAHKFTALTLQEKVRLNAVKQTKRVALLVRQWDEISPFDASFNFAAYVWQQMTVRAAALVCVTTPPRTLGPRGRCADETPHATCCTRRYRRSTSSCCWTS